jgi:hypothetical protein
MSVRQVVVAGVMHTVSMAADIEKSLHCDIAAAGWQVPEQAE